MGWRLASRAICPVIAPKVLDSIARQIAVIPLSKMENTTFAMSSIIDSHDMGLRTVYSPDARNSTPIQHPKSPLTMNLVTHRVASDDFHC
ncbi:hypothetical protein TNCV_717321 [Trichonephila clavipes]|nr:hypothetical protein TNCV_717321 [Trichonephila clavipes]